MNLFTFRVPSISIYKTDPWCIISLVNKVINMHDSNREEDSSKSITTEELLEGILEGNERYETIFYKRQYSLVYNVAKSRLNYSDDVEIAANEALLTFFTQLKAGKISSLDNKAGYLKTVASRAATGVKRVNERVSTETPADEKEAERTMSNVEPDLFNIFSLTNQLSADEAAVIDAVYKEGMTTADAARDLGISYSTVVRLKGRAINKLKDIASAGFIEEFLLAEREWDKNTDTQYEGGFESLAGYWKEEEVMHSQGKAPLKQAEDWKSLFNGAEVSSKGRIKTKVGKRNAILNTRGKTTVKLTDEEGERKTYRIDDLVADAFLIKPAESKTLIHLDNVLSNSCLDNIRWSPLTTEEREEVIKDIKKQKQRHAKLQWVA